MGNTARLELLREFETKVLSIESPDLNGMVKLVLETAGSLSGIDEGWGQLTLLRPGIDPDKLETNRTFGITYSQDANIFYTRLDDNQSAIMYPAIRRAIVTKIPALILDPFERQSEAAGDYIPWATAHSLIIVPLLGPKDSDSESQRTTGALILASLQRTEFRESDIEIFSRFAQYVVLSLSSVQHLERFDRILGVIRHELSQRMGLAEMKLALFRRSLIRRGDSSGDSDGFIQQVDTQLADVARSLGTGSSVMRWLIDFFNDHIVPESASDGYSMLSAADVVERLRQPVDMLAEDEHGKEVLWQIPDHPVFIAGGKDRHRLIEAILYKYLDEALRQSGEKGIIFSVSYQPMETPMVVFEVSSLGSRINHNSYRLSFESDLELRRVAQRLGGTIAFSHGFDGRNIFSLFLPAVVAEGNPSSK